MHFTVPSKRYDVTYYVIIMLNYDNEDCVVIKFLHQNK